MYEKLIAELRQHHCDAREDDTDVQRTSRATADVVEEDNILKFYYVRSIGEYWIGRRIDNFYYAEYDPKRRQWVWTHSRYLPWGKHVVSPTSLWKEHTYPSEPEEIPFEEWLQGFIKKYAADAIEALSKTEKTTEELQADVRPVVRGKWLNDFCGKGRFSKRIVQCSLCGNFLDLDGVNAGRGDANYCPNCGADMREPPKEESNGV